jgi:hypothetical protein
MNYILKTRVTSLIRELFAFSAAICVISIFIGPINGYALEGFSLEGFKSTFDSVMSSVLECAVNSVFMFTAQFPLALNSDKVVQREAKIAFKPHDVLKVSSSLICISR